MNGYTPSRLMRLCVRAIRARSRWLMVLMLCIAAITASAPSSAAGESIHLEPLGVAEAIRQLDATDWLLQAEALHALRRYGVPSVAPRLRRMVDDQTRPTWLRGEALWTLAHSDPTAARPIAEARLDDDDPTWRAAAARALGVLGTETDLVRLVAMHERDPARSVRWAALQALAEASPQHAWPRLQKQLGSGLQPADVEPAVDILLTLDTDQARDAMQRILWNSDMAVRRAAAEVVVRRQVSQAPAWLVTRLAETRSAEERQHLRTLLPQLPAARVGRALVELLRRPETDAATFRVGLAVLERIADQPIAARLAEVLPELARHRATALPRVLDLLRAVGADRHADAIARLLDDRFSHDVRRAAVRALGELDVNHFERFAPLMTAEDHVLHEPVLDVLARRTEGVPAGGLAAYLEPLLEHAGDHPRPAVKAIQLLIDRADQLKDDEAESLVTRLRPWLVHDDDALSDAAIALLRRVASEQAARHLAAARGYIAEWHLLGPFPNDEQNSGLHKVYPPERGVDLDAVYDGADDRRIRWRRWRADSVDAKVELHTLMPLPVEHRTAYGFTTFTTNRRRTIAFHIEADESFKLFLNGGKIAERQSAGVERVRVPVPPGEHELLIKVTNLRERWFFQLRLTTPAGEPLDRAVGRASDER